MPRPDWRIENFCRCGAHITRVAAGWIDDAKRQQIVLMGQPHTHAPKYAPRDEEKETGNG